MDEHTNSHLVYPNPAATILNLELPVAGAWEMVDLSGRQVLAPKRYQVGINTIDVSELPAGNYLLRNTHSPFSVVKVVKE